MLAVASLVVATLFDVEDLYPFSLGAEPQQSAEQASLTSDVGASPSPVPEDSMYLMQGVNIHVDLLGTRVKEASSSSPPHLDKHVAKDEDDASLFSGVPIISKSRKKAPDVSLVSLSGGHAMTFEAASRIAAAALSWRSSMRQTIRHRLGAGSTGGIAVAMLVLLIGCTCMAAVTIVYPNKFPWSGGRQGHVAEEPGILETVVKRVPILSQKPPTMSMDDVPRAPATAPWGSALSPFASALMPTPAMTAEQLPLPSAEALSVPQPPESQDAARPPPLCPTLVMPICEARFGVPMYELAQLSTEGDLNIIGLSGNPLLRAVVRKIGVARTLEISMPEQNSAPRATISPSTTEIAGHGQQGCRALEIRGMRGSFYGILEMRSSGACYVVRDGQTVLTIDGDADSLQLSIKSSVGVQLASVRCSAEPFGGVDHVEIRVEPGVDTVLVLAVVLAVLLLSPYLMER